MKHFYLFCKVAIHLHVVPDLTGTYYHSIYLNKSLTGPNAKILFLLHQARPRGQWTHYMPIRDPTFYNNFHLQSLTTGLDPQVRVCAIQNFNERTAP